MNRYCIRWPAFLPIVISRNVESRLTDIVFMLQGICETRYFVESLNISVISWNPVLVRDLV